MGGKNAAVVLGDAGLRKRADAMNVGNPFRTVPRWGRWSTPPPAPRSGPKEQGRSAREFFTHTTTVYLRGGQATM
ncbi:hypothetical protein [Rhodococcus jostii]|uniref:hypothetical protein n=1 Tax=Rhodococcus jostii TaxID=132919 RepID=UPI0002EF1F04|nr:hypothetical protein [Rhodococcus jostii]